MVKDHSDSEKGNPLPLHRVLLYAPSHRQDNTYHGLCYTSRGALDGTLGSRVRLFVTSMTFSDSLISSSFAHLIDNKHIIIANGIGIYIFVNKTFKQYIRCININTRS